MDGSVNSTEEGYALELRSMRLERRGRVGRLTLDRPRLLNAVDYQATLDLNELLDAIEADDALRVLVIRGEGRAFCTGIDLKQLSAGETPVEYYERWDRALRVIELMDAFVVCAIHGYALGGGLQLALASDVRIATTDAQLGLPAINESIVPGLSTFRLPRYIGWGRAKWMVLTGENVDGVEAARIGLVDRVVAPDALEDAVTELVERLLATCSMGARHSKALLALHADLPHEAFFEEYLRRQRLCVVSSDHEEARRAYRERRPPIWS
ncbi:MAG: enoyl-CoA hydratase/isomerase family protein [Gemmatimonadetes bacterium]|nr:enoyl-CoA hydratase/isomerase family protein [Gemmatimonadota bacterium]